MRMIKQIVGYLHNASLLVDDIEDNSKLRRGKPVAHMIYGAWKFDFVGRVSAAKDVHAVCVIGVPSTLNCANYVYFLALESCLELQNTEAVAFMTAELLNLHRGQGRGLVPAH